MKRLPWLDFLSLALIVLVGFQVTRLSSRVARLEKSEIVGDALQDARLFPMDARDVTGRSHLIAADRPRIVFYLSPKCGACSLNLPVWSEIAHRIGPKNALALFADGDPATAASISGYLSSGNLGDVEAVRVSQTVFDKHRMYEVPRTMLVDGDGNVLQVWRGRVNAESVLKAWSGLKGV